MLAQSSNLVIVGKQYISGQCVCNCQVTTGAVNMIQEVASVLRRLKTEESFSCICTQCLALTPITRFVLVRISLSLG